MAWSPHLIDPDQPFNRLCRAAPCLARRRDDWQPQVGLPRPGHRPWITDTTSNLKDNPRSSRSIVLGIDQPAPGGVDVKASAASTWRAQHRTEREQTTQSNQPGRLDRPRSFRDDLPLAFGVTVSYRGPLGQKYPVDRYTLDLGMYAETLFPQRACPNSSKRSPRSARNSDGGAPASVGCLSRRLTSASRTAATSVRSTFIFFATRGPKRSRVRYGCARFSASGSAR